MSGFKFKKKLGQHFLNNQEILQKICSIRNLNSESILEIGPGMGSLTKKILECNPKELLVIEKDISLEPYLESIKQEHSDKLKIIFGNALEIDLVDIFNEKIVLIANLPYNVASTLIINWLQNLEIFKSIIVMVQKEVAERFIAKVNSKQYGRISVLIQIFCDIKKKFDVSPDNFFPKPKVESSVIEIIPKENIKVDYKKIDKVLKLSFLHRRKTIKNNFKKKNIDTKKLPFDNDTLDNLRPQEISPEKYLKLTKHLFG